MHDRGACITTKMLLSKNADVSIKESNIEGNKLVTDRKWAAPEAVWEIVEAISNYTVLTYYIRNYSYEGLAISRAYHDMGFFLGTVSSEKEQMNKNVLDWEPHVALFVEDKEPLIFYNNIADIARNILNKNGKLYFEINERFGKDIVELLEKKGFVNIELKKDINDKDRMIKAIWK